MRWLTAWFNMGATPARRALLAVGASTPFFILFLSAHAWALREPDVRAGLQAEVMWMLQAVLTVTLLANVGVGLYLWPRRAQPDPVPGAVQVVCVSIATGFSSVAIAAGTFTSGTGLILLGALAVGLLLFEIAPVLLAYAGSVVALVVHDVGVQQGWWAYAPALRAHAFADGRPAWWLALWRQFMFMGGFITLIFLLLLSFASLDRLQAELARLSNTDGLTGLANRRRFMEVLRNEVARQARTGHPLCLVFIDADHFKDVNDTCGHQAGDAVLCEIGRLMMRCVRTPIDLACRLGGEEFALILPDTTLEQAMGVCTRLRAQLLAESFCESGKIFHVTLSMGLVEGQGLGMEALLALADEQLYRAKADGRDRICATRAPAVGEQGGAPDSQRDGP